MFESLPFMPKPMGPPWLPASVAEARKWAYWSVLIAFLILIVEVIVVIFLALFYIGMIFFIIGPVVITIVILFLIKMTVFDPLDQGKFKDANIFMLIWGILGLFSLFGILMLIGFLKLQDVFSPQYQQYQAQPGQVGQVPPQQSQYQAPPQQPAPAPVAPQEQPAPHAQNKVEMVKCTKCGVQYPAFMHHCPNCNQQR
jgi:hypothetical protein